MPRLLRHGRRAGLALLLAATPLLAPCATGTSRSDDTPTSDERAPLPAGADRWEGGALELPARSPAVASARVDALLRTTRQLRSWIAAEPAMFGDNGERIVRRFRAGWNQISRAFGFDPLSEGTPARVGLDGDRPLFVGLYPTRRVGGPFVDRVEATLRRVAKIEDDTSLPAALAAMQAGERETPSDLSARLLESVESVPSHAGFRIVAPVDDASELLGRIRAAASAGGYREMDLEGVELPEDDREQEVPDAVGLYSRGSPWPAMLIRPGSEWLKVDVLFQGFQVRPGGRDASGVDGLREALVELVDSSPPGSPTAPRPEDTPALALAADQAGTAAFARLQLYKQAINAAAQRAVDRRNAGLVADLRRAAVVGEDWRQGADELSGTSYSLHVADETSDDIFRLRSSLYGPPPDRTPDIDALEIGLGVDDRGFGASVDLDPVFDEAWQDWLRVESDPEESNYASLAEEYPIPYLLSLPRNFAFLVGNTDRTVRDALPDALADAYSRLRNLQRIEIATAGVDVRALRTDPKLVGLVTFDPEADRDAIDSTLDSFPAFIEFFLDTSEEDADDEGPTVPGELKRKQLTRLSLPPSHPADPLRYFLEPRESGAWAFFSHGLDRAEAQRELGAIRSGERKPANDRAFFVRLEPATAVAALTAFDTDAYEPIDLGILAQRIGPLVLDAAPHRTDSYQALRYELTLEQPPEL